MRRIGSGNVAARVWARDEDEAPLSEGRLAPRAAPVSRLRLPRREDVPSDIREDAGGGPRDVDRFLGDDASAAGAEVDEVMGGREDVLDEAV